MACSKKKKSKWKSLLCKLFGHKRIFIVEDRTRIHGKKGNRYGSMILSLNRKGGKGGYTTNTTGGYYVCERCGKKLTHFERL